MPQARFEKCLMHMHLLQNVRWAHALLVYNWKKDAVPAEILHPDDRGGMQAGTAALPRCTMVDQVCQLEAPDIESNPPGKH